MATRFMLKKNFLSKVDKEATPFFDAYSKMIEKRKKVEKALFIIWVFAIFLFVTGIFCISALGEPFIAMGLCSISLFMTILIATEDGNFKSKVKETEKNLFSKLVSILSGSEDEIKIGKSLIRASKLFLYDSVDVKDILSKKCENYTFDVAKAEFKDGRRTYQTIIFCTPFEKAKTHTLIYNCGWLVKPFRFGFKNIQSPYFDKKEYHLMKEKEGKTAFLTKDLSRFLTHLKSAYYGENTSKRMDVAFFDGKMMVAFYDSMNKFSLSDIDDKMKTAEAFYKDVLSIYKMIEKLK